MSWLINITQINRMRKNDVSLNATLEHVRFGNGQAWATETPMFGRSETTKERKHTVNGE
jgi:hypothetical protein